VAETFRYIASGVWHIYQTPQGGNPVLAGAETDSGKARQIFHNAIRDEPATTLIELVNPVGEVIDHSQGAYMGPHSTLRH
jgi:hypothetical protein